MTAGPAKKSPKIGIGVLIFKGNQLLVGKRKGSHGTGTYALPGGHLEFLETLETCAVRETFEETGLAVANPRLAWIENSIWGQGHDQQHYVTIFMRCDLLNENGEAKVLEPDKCEEWRWIEYPSVPEPVFQPLQQMLRSTYDPHKPLAS